MPLSASRLLSGDRLFSATNCKTASGLVYEYCLNAQPMPFLMKNSLLIARNLQYRNRRSASVSL